MPRNAYSLENGIYRCDTMIKSNSDSSIYDFTREEDKKSTSSKSVSDLSLLTEERVPLCSGPGDGSRAILTFISSGAAVASTVLSVLDATGAAEIPSAAMIGLGSVGGITGLAVGGTIASNAMGKAGWGKWMTKYGPTRKKTEKDYRKEEERVMRDDLIRERIAARKNKQEMRSRKNSLTNKKNECMENAIHRRNSTGSILNQDTRL